ncbi:MAG: hypothetical protein J6X50_01985 [Bacilli bacterium]|nr:hypothetical protein [Bacilli bacterium]
MRKQYLFWAIAVFGIFATVYGTYLLIYHFDHGNGLSIPALLLLIFGSLSLVVVLILYIYSFLTKNKQKDEPVPPIEEQIIEEKEIEPLIEEDKPITITNSEPVVEEEEECVSQPKRTYSSSSSYSYSTVYVKQVGYGPLLRIIGNQIVDMRSNTYYRLENNILMQDGYDPIYEIRGNQVKDAFGGYLYELSGSNINKTFGGFYSSISGNYITLYDGSIKYEMSDSLSKSQILAVIALLFGK